MKWPWRESKWAGFPLLAFDTESTGVNPLEARIVQLALVEIRPNSRPVETTYLVDPGVEIPEGAAAVHGLTREYLQANATHTPDQMLFEATGRIALWLGKGFPVVAFNAAYDLTLLEAENARHGIDSLAARLGPGKVSPIVDPMVLDKYAVQKRRGSRKLVDVCKVYGVRHAGAHDATADAVAAARLFPRIMTTHARKFPGQTLMGLHHAQIGWRKEQQDGLREYFDQKGTDHDGCCGEWPIHIRCAPVGVAS